MSIEQKLEDLTLAVSRLTEVMLSKEPLVGQPVEEQTVPEDDVAPETKKKKKAAKKAKKKEKPADTSVAEGLLDDEPEEREEALPPVTVEVKATRDEMLAEANRNIALQGDDTFAVSVLELHGATKFSDLTDDQINSVYAAFKGKNDE